MQTKLFTMDLINLKSQEYPLYPYDYGKSVTTTLLNSRVTYVFRVLYDRIIRRWFTIIGQNKVKENLLNLIYI